MLRRRMILDGDENVINKWNLINDITLENESNIFEITKDLTGAEFSYDEIILFLQSVGVEGNTGNNNAVMKISGIGTFYINSIGMVKGVTRTLKLQMNAKPLFYEGLIMNSGLETAGGSIVGSPVAGYSFNDPIEKINSVNITLQAMKFGIGSRLKAYGR